MGVSRPRLVWARLVWSRLLWSRLLWARLVWAVSAAALVLGCAAALALEPSTPLNGYARQTWVMDNGLPQNTVQAILQTRDGFLWIGTQAGLVRFDGVAFQVFDRASKPALPGVDVRCLLQTPDGALWIGTGAGLARWADDATGGRVTTYTTRDGLPDNGIVALGEAANGNLLVWTAQGPAVRQGNRFAPVTGSSAFSGATLPAPWEYPGPVAFREQIGNGAQVSGNRSSLDIREPGRDAPIHLAAGKDLPGSRIQTVFADRSGALWIGTNAGLARWIDDTIHDGTVHDDTIHDKTGDKTGGRVELLPAADPLATASILAITEDREGDLWVGTDSGGLDVLRDRRFRIRDTRDGLSSDRITAVVEDRSGTLWVGTDEDGLNAVRRDGPDGKWSVRAYTVADGLASNVILSLAAAPDGALWVGTPDGLSRIAAGRADTTKIDTFTAADGLPDDFIRSLQSDKDGSLWIGTRRGLAHWQAGSDGHGLPRIDTYTQAMGLGSDLVGALARGRDGSLWIATLGGLSRLHDGKISNYTTADGLSSNVITALLPRGDGTLVIGTEHGWDVWNGRGFSAAGESDGGRASIHAILADSEGHLWFATGNGIARCDYAGGANCSRWMEFGTADGLRSRDTATNSHPSAWRSRDGRLWFATPRGLVEVDPEDFPVNALPPPVALERFVVDDVNHPLTADGPVTTISAGHVHFEFDYAGLSFVAPRKVRYRYRLEGFDRAWTNAGARRAAYYTNIPPGRYTFRVQAANNDGVWNGSGASFSFDLRPHFYQTLWFYALLLAALAGTILLLVRQRLRLAEREFRAVLRERGRIAREIHDTLAQGYAGISIQLEVLAGLLRTGKTDAAQKHLDQTREQVREGLADARQSIWALRTQDAGETTLPVRLRRLAEAAADGALAVQFNSFGAYRPLPAQTETELLRVAQEAIHNVKKHAGAATMSVQVEYGRDTIALEVRDDGRGGAAEQSSQGASGQPGRSGGLGHFGLTGMRERAEAIGGTLEISSAPGEGTAVRLRAPAPRAPEREAEREQER